jgi:hypothetical protein
MKVQVVGIADRGIPNRERVHLSVVADGDLSYFVVLKTLLAAPEYNRVFGGTAAAYWFPTTPVKAGDQVILASGTGKNSKRQEPSGASTHFFFWGMPNTLWNTTADNVVVIQAAEWVASRFGG